MNLVVGKNQKITQTSGKCLDMVHKYLANS